MKDPRRGFTLIELLVVIAIIGMLSSVVLASLNTARTKGAYAKKKEELNQISLALYSYYLDRNAVPANPSPGFWVTADSALSTLVTNGYMPQIPTSPDSQAYYYYDYGTYVMVSSYMGEDYGPGTSGWHCSDASGGTSGSKFWCVEFQK